jgi:hypothetical protein
MRTLKESILSDIEDTIKTGNKIIKTNFKSILSVKSESEFNNILKYLNNIVAPYKVEDKNQLDNHKRYVMFGNKNNTNFIIYGRPKYLFICYFKDGMLINKSLPNYTLEWMFNFNRFSDFTLYTIPKELESSEKILQSKQNVNGIKTNLNI